MNLLFFKSKKGIIISVILLLLIFIGILLINSKDIFADAFSKNNETKVEEDDFFKELDNEMSKALDANLSDYRKYDKLKEDDVDLFYVIQQIPKNYGDYYAIYLNEQNDKCKVLKQDLDGVYTLFEFEKNKESKCEWIISGEKSVQGEYKFINDYFIENQNPEGMEHGREETN